MIAVLLLLLAPPAQQPSGGPPLRPRPVTAPRTRYDSTVVVVRDIGSKVADVKTSLDLFNRASGARSSAEMLQRASGLRASCEAMATAIQRGVPLLCRGCLSRESQRAIDQYRAYLPSLARIGRQCAARIGQLTRSGTEDTKATALRREASPLSGRLVGGIVPYEQRLRVVRLAFGWESQSPRPANPPPPRPGPSAPAAPRPQRGTRTSGSTSAVPVR